MDVDSKPEGLKVNSRRGLGDIGGQGDQGSRGLTFEEKAIRKFRRKGGALQTNAFLIIPDPLLKDPDENLIINLLRRTQRMIKLSNELWPVMQYAKMKPMDRFMKIRSSILAVHGCGETWVKMLMVVLDISQPQRRLLHDQCEVGVGSIDPLIRISEQTFDRAEGSPIQGRNGKMKALTRLRDHMSRSSTFSATCFREILKDVEKKMQRHFKQHPLIVNQMKMHEEQGLSCSMLQTQLCEFRQLKDCP